LTQTSIKKQDKSMSEKPHSDQDWKKDLRDRMDVSESSTVKMIVSTVRELGREGSVIQSESRISLDSVGGVPFVDWLKMQPRSILFLAAGRGTVEMELAEALGVLPSQVTLLDRNEIDDEALDEPDVTYVHQSIEDWAGEVLQSESTGPESQYAMIVILGAEYALDH
jgi:hypothetical protein